MYEDDHLEVWNLTDGGQARCGAVDIFNIVGRLKAPGDAASLSYRLNGGEPCPVYFNASGETEPRVTSPGDFNIDTINHGDLRDTNTIVFELERRSGERTRHELTFRANPFSAEERSYALDLEGRSGPEEAGQVVEGPWRIGADASGRRCLEIAPEQAGYDRIILFGSRDWTTGYEIRTRLAVTAITGNHNVGIVFKWNPHEQGDGRRLPTTWSTGLAYYRSYKPRGLKVRFGVGVHRDAQGRLAGDHVLARVPMSRLQFSKAALLRRLGLGGPASAMQVGREYVFRMRVDPERYALTVWRADRREPAPQVVVDGPPDLLPTGPPGVIAYHIGIRVYEFEVRPL
jgi:hypothetical protein